MKVKIIKDMPYAWYINLADSEPEYDVIEEHEFFYTVTIGGLPRVLLKEYCEVIIPSNRQKAIQMLATCDGLYSDQVDMVEKLLNDIDSANEKVKSLNEILK